MRLMKSAWLLGAVGACVFGSAACESEPEELVCTDDLQFITGSLSADAALDAALPADEVVVFDGSVQLIHDCETRSDTFVVASGALVDSDQTTKLFDLDGEFAGGEATVDCSGVGHDAKSFGLELSGPTQEELTPYCGKTIWIELVMVRKGCEEGERADQLFGSQIFIPCP